MREDNHVLKAVGSPDSQPSPIGRLSVKHIGPYRIYRSRMVSSQKHFLYDNFRVESENIDFEFDRDEELDRIGHQSVPSSAREMHSLIAELSAAAFSRSAGRLTLRGCPANQLSKGPLGPFTSCGRSYQCQSKEAYFESS